MARLITQQQLMLLLRNHRDGAGKKTPVAKIFNPAGAQTWLIHSADPGEPDILHALCDLGFGCAELGSVRLSDLEGIETPIRVGPYSGAVRLERDKFFRPVHSLEIYARADPHPGPHHRADRRPGRRGHRGAGPRRPRQTFCLKARASRPRPQARASRRRLKIGAENRAERRIARDLSRRGSWNTPDAKQARCRACQGRGKR